MPRMHKISVVTSSDREIFRFFFSTLSGSEKRGDGGCIRAVGMEEAGA